MADPIAFFSYRCIQQSTSQNHELCRSPFEHFHQKRADGAHKGANGPCREPERLPLKRHYFDCFLFESQSAADQRQEKSIDRSNGRVGRYDHVHTLGTGKDFSWSVWTCHCNQSKDLLSTNERVQTGAQPDSEAIMFTRA